MPVFLSRHKKNLQSAKQLINYNLQNSLMAIHTLFFITVSHFSAFIDAISALKKLSLANVNDFLQTVDRGLSVIGSTSFIPNLRENVI